MVVCVRHGQTAYNATKHGGEAELYRGNLDIPLNDQGRRESVEAAGKIGLPVKFVVSDQKRRDWETGAIIAQFARAPHLLDDRLAPLDIGLLSGKSRKEVADLVDWYFQNPTVSFPEGETVGSWYHRQKSAIFHYLDVDNGDRRTAIVLICQGSTFRSLAAMANQDDWSLIESTMERVPTGDLEWLT